MSTDTPDVLTPLGNSLLLARGHLLKAWEQSGEGALGPIAKLLSGVDAILEGRTPASETKVKMPAIGNCHCPDPDDCLYGGPACPDGEERKRRAAHPSDKNGKAWTEMSPLERSAYNAGALARSMTDEQVMRDQQAEIERLKSSVSAIDASLRDKLEDGLCLLMVTPANQLGAEKEYDAMQKWASECMAMLAATDRGDNQNG